MPDELAGELMQESRVQFLQLNAVEVAVQLTLQDFAIFTQVPTDSAFPVVPRADGWKTGSKFYFVSMLVCLFVCVCVCVYVLTPSFFFVTSSHFA